MKFLLNNVLTRTNKMLVKHLPYYATGTVVNGFGRGSKELGIPTANLPENVVKQLPDDFGTGVYFGWAKIQSENEVLKMVMSIGWNPFYKNEMKTMEVHILHDFNRDFYDETLQICICGFIRNEKNFDSVDALVKEINNDISYAKTQLDNPEYAKLSRSPYFQIPEAKM